VTTRRYIRIPPDSGMIDPIAVQIAASGELRVRLTKTERELAADSILAQGGGAALIARRLHVSGTIARALAAQRETELEAGS
jgi:hypothetical protein